MNGFVDRCEYLLDQMEPVDRALFSRAEPQAYHDYWHQAGAELMPGTAPDNFVATMVATEAIHTRTLPSQRFVEMADLSDRFTGDRRLDTIRLWTRRLGHANTEGLVPDMRMAAEWLDDELTTTKIKFGYKRTIAELRIEAARLSGMAGVGTAYETSIRFNRRLAGCTDGFRERFRSILLHHALKIEQVKGEAILAGEPVPEVAVANSLVGLAAETREVARELSAEVAADRLESGCLGNAMGMLGEAVHYLKDGVDIVNAGLSGTHHVLVCTDREEQSYVHRTFEEEKRAPNWNSDHKIVSHTRQGEPVTLLKQVKLTDRSYQFKGVIFPICEGVSYARDTTSRMFEGNLHAGNIPEAICFEEPGLPMGPRRNALRSLIELQLDRLKSGAA